MGLAAGGDARAGPLHRSRGVLPARGAHTMTRRIVLAVALGMVVLGGGAASGADDRDALSRKMPPFRLMLANQMTDELPLTLQLSGRLAALPVSERSVVVLGFSYAAYHDALPEQADVAPPRQIE